ncbi:alpha/beta hydrolase-fold protein [uncultured Clostridium sp.]|uniref:alpha/beta hydrolase n=1 Tax=uncultured Clostridium sp. TaxID=59620 RepID=UPI002621A927|nr:alpha/beta hydrolase-fold protein [uncultured Clostridium sp.]
MNLEKFILNSVKEKQEFKNSEIKFPLIQKIENEDLDVFIIFVYIGDKDTKNVLVISPLGGKNIKENLMKNIEGTNIWYKKYISKNDIKFRYYFSINDSLDNNWCSRIKNRMYDRLNNLKLKFDDETVMSYVVMPKCKNILYKNENLNNGKLIKHNIYSNFLKEFRNLVIYNPYEIKDITKECGVIVFLDGKEHIDLLNANLILDKLNSEHKIQPIIGIFVESNEKSRSRDLRYNSMFEKFIINEAIPFVKRKYNIIIDPHKNIITGFSLGGMMATYIALRNSDIFRNVISQSASYHFKVNTMKKEIRDCNNKLNIYMDVGILEDRNMMINPNNKIYSILRKKGFKIKYEMFKSGHDYLSWGEFLYRGLIFIEAN